MKLEECLLRYTNGAEVKYLGPVYHIASDRILEEFAQTFKEDILNIKDAFERWEKYGEQICFRF